MGQISTKLSKVQGVCHVYNFDVGYVFEVSGVSVSDPEEWTTFKVAVVSDEELLALIQESRTLPLVG